MVHRSGNINRRWLTGVGSLVGSGVSVIMAVGPGVGPGVSVHVDGSVLATPSKIEPHKIGSPLSTPTGGPSIILSTTQYALKPQYEQNVFSVALDRAFTTAQNPGGYLLKSIGAFHAWVKYEFDAIINIRAFPLQLRPSHTGFIPTASHTEIITSPKLSLFCVQPETTNSSTFLLTPSISSTPKKSDGGGGGAKEVGPGVSVIMDVGPGVGPGVSAHVDGSVPSVASVIRAHIIGKSVPS